MATNDNDQILSNAENYLFAVDLVNYIFNCNTPYNIILTGTEEYRDFAVSLFDDNMRRAVDFLNIMLRLEGDEKIISDLIMLGNGLCFKHFVRKTKAEFFRDGCDPDSVLRYSVRLASLAAKFYLNGMEEALQMAIKYISKALKHNLSNDGMEKLEMIAQNYVTISSLEIHHSSSTSEYFEVPTTAENYKSADHLKSYEHTTCNSDGEQCKEERLHNHYAGNKNQRDDEQIKADPLQNKSLSLTDNTLFPSLDSVTCQKFKSSLATCSSCSASSYLATSDYIPIPGTSREKDIDVIYRIPCFCNQLQNSVSKSQSKTYNSAESIAGSEKNSKKPQIDNEDYEKHSSKSRIDSEEDKINSMKLRRYSEEDGRNSTKLKMVTD